MFKLSVNTSRYGLLLFLVFLMVTASSGSPIVERIRRGAGAGNCNGGRNHYQTFCYGARNGDAHREANVQRCFDKLYGSLSSWGCASQSDGRCRCTVDSSFIWDASKTFREARQRLYEQCHGFTNNIMERYEGNMYLTATCD